MHGGRRGPALAAWLAENVAERERRPERVRDELLARCRGERIEPPSEGRIDRVVRSALRVGEEAVSSRVAGRLSEGSKLRITALLAVDDESPAEPGRMTGSRWPRSRRQRAA